MPHLALVLAVAAAVAVTPAAALWRPTPLRAAAPAFTLTPAGDLTLALRYRTWDGYFADGVSLPAGTRLLDTAGGRWSLGAALTISIAPASVNDVDRFANLYNDDTSGTTGVTVAGIHEAANGCTAASPAAACPCGAAGPAFVADATLYACRTQAPWQAAVFNVTAAVAVAGVPGVAAAWAAPWSVGVGGGAGGAAASAAVVGLSPLTNRKSTAANLWCRNATDATGFLVKMTAVRPALIAAGVPAASLPAANVLGMDAALWSACVSPQCGPANASYVRGACTAVQGGPIDDQWGAFRGVLPGPASALPGGNCSLLSIAAPPTPGAAWAHWIECRYNATGTQYLALNVTVTAATARLEAGDGDAAAVGGAATAWPPGATAGTLPLTLANNGTATATLSVAPVGCCVATADGGPCGSGAAPVVDVTPPPAAVVAPRAVASFSAAVTGATPGAYGRCTFTVSVDGVAKAGAVAAYFHVPPVGAPPPPATTVPPPPPTTTTVPPPPTTTTAATPPPPTTTTAAPPPPPTTTAVPPPPPTTTAAPPPPPPPTTTASPPPPTTTTTTTTPAPSSSPTPTPSAVATPAPRPPPPPPTTTYHPVLSFVATFPNLSTAAADAVFQARYRAAVAAAAKVSTAAVRVVGASPGVVVASLGVALTTEVTFPAATSTAAADAFGTMLELTRGGVLAAADPTLTSTYGTLSLASVTPAELLTASPPPPPTTTTSPALTCPFGPPDCSGHGTPTPPCECVCDAGWGTAQHQDLSNYKYCGVTTDILGRVDPPAPAPAPPPGAPPPPSPPPPPSSPASRVWQILTQLRTLSGRQLVVAAGGLALVGCVAFCAFRCCARCGLCPCLPACCGGGRRRRRRDNAWPDDDDDADGLDAPRRRRASVAAALAARRARRAAAEARLFDAVEVEGGAQAAPLPPFGSLADVAALAGAWRGPAVAAGGAPPAPDVLTSALVEALRRAAAASPLSPPPPSQASAEAVALLAALQGGGRG